MVVRGGLLRLRWLTLSRASVELGDRCKCILLCLEFCPVVSWGRMWGMGVVWRVSMVYSATVLCIFLVFCSAYFCEAEFIAEILEICSDSSDVITASFSVPPNISILGTSPCVPDLSFIVLNASMSASR